jgi:quercetin dioxygenase-like cupin family protein
MQAEPLKPTKQNESRVTYECGPVFYITATAGGILADHRHDEAETLWIVSGKGKIQLGDQTTEFEAPCVLKIPGGIYHKFMPVTDVNFIEQIHEAV